MRIRHFCLLPPLVSVLLACGGPEKLTQSEWERYQEIRAETQALLDDLHRTTLAAAKIGESADQRSAYAAHQGLFESGNIDFLRRVKAELTDSVAALRVTRLRSYLTECALTSMRLQYLSRTPLLASAREMPEGRRWRGSLPTSLITEDNREIRELEYSRWIGLLSESLELVDAWRIRQDSLLQAHGYDSWNSFVTQSLGLESAEILQFTGTIITATDGLYRELLQKVVSAGGLDCAGQPDRLDLARFVEGRGAAKPPLVYPLEVILAGLHGGCAADDELADKIALSVGTSSTSPTTVPLSAPDEVVLVIPPVGDQRQAVKAVAAYAEALVYSSSDSRDFVDIYLDRDPELATAATYLAALYVVGDCETHPLASSFPTEFALRKLIELRSLCADIQLALTWQPGQVSSADTLLETYTRALGVDIAMPELLPRLCRIDFCAELSKLRGIMAAYESLPKRRTISELLTELREGRINFDLKQSRVDDLFRAFDRVLTGR